MAHYLNATNIASLIVLLIAILVVVLSARFSLRQRRVPRPRPAPRPRPTVSVWANFVQRAAIAWKWLLKGASNLSKRAWKGVTNSHAKLAPHVIRVCNHLWPESNDDTDAHIAVKPWKYWSLIVLLSIAAFILLLSDVWFPHLLGGIQLGPIYFSDSWPLSLLLVGYVYDAWHTVREKQYGGIFVFHQPAITVGPGPKLSFRGFMEIHRVPRDVQTFQFPAAPDKISHVHDDQPLEPGLVRPIRILTGPPDPTKDLNDPLNSQRTLEIQWYARWNVARLQFFDFWDRLPGSSWEEKKALLFEQMRTAGDVVLAGDLNDMPPFQITSKLEALNKKLKKKLQDRFDGSGIVIVEAGLQSPDLGLTVSQALSQLAASKAEAARTVIRAKARRTELTEEGFGTAAAREALLAAEGKGLAQAADAMKVESREYLAAHIAEEAIGEGTVFLGIPGINDVAKLGESVLNIFKKPETPTPAP